LTCLEDLSIRPVVQGIKLTPQQEHAHADYIMSVIRYPLRWLSGNPQGNPRALAFDPQMYSNGHALLELAWNYEYFACAFIYMHRGAIEIELDGRVLKPKHGFLDRPEFEAYSILSTNVEDESAIDLNPEVRVDFDSRVRVKGARFHCAVNPVFIRRLMEISRPLFLNRFQLPLEWRFSRYTVGEYAEIYLALFAICLINYNGRLVAIQKAVSILVSPIQS
jgi:hypothetical protein